MRSYHWSSLLSGSLLLFIIFTIYYRYLLKKFQSYTKSKIILINIGAYIIYIIIDIDIYFFKSLLFITILITIIFVLNIKTILFYWGKLENGNIYIYFLRKMISEVNGYSHLNLSSCPVLPTVVTMCVI